MPYLTLPYRLCWQPIGRMNIEPRTPAASRITHGLFPRTRPGCSAKLKTPKPSFGPFESPRSRFVVQQGNCSICKGIKRDQSLCKSRYFEHTPRAVYISLYSIPAMSNPNQLFLLADHIKLSLLERQRAISLNLEPNSQDGHISRSLESFRAGLENIAVERESLEDAGDTAYVQIPPPSPPS
jgi:hypothetical protein